MNYIISFYSIANANAFCRQNTFENELIERGRTYIIVNEDFMTQANWINSDHVYQINQTA